MKKSVRRAPIKKPAPKPKKARKKPRPAPAAKKKAAPHPRLSSLQQGIALMRQERYEAARPWLQKGVQEERRNPEAWYWYGMYHEKTAQFEQAQFFYRKAMALDPGFEPFSRVVAYPGDGDRVPLWDPRRPARIYPIPTNDHGIAIIPPDAPQARRRPVRPPIDPELPKVPLYVPPEPGAAPFGGDAWQPSVYVPPGRERMMEGGDPVYTPPESRVLPLAAPPPVGVALPPEAVSPSVGEVSVHAAPLAAPPEPRDVRPGASPVYQPPMPGAGTGAPGVPPSPASAAEGPVYRPPLPGNDGASMEGGAVSGDQPVHLPPLPSEKH
ncbi:MAG: tetratricopeptide repeat protein [Fretibacterium sp.]|nr:tetratricopeptide repeat protein [Fretibacterium sp.]